MFTMRFDMRAPGKDAAQRAALYRCAIDMAAYADQRGCASVIISEHHASDDGYLPSPFPLAAAMAAVTSSVPIVVAAAILPLYEPVRMAEDMIVLDHISGGRTMFVLGLGYRPVEYELHGVAYDERGRVADEKLTALLDALRASGAGTGITPPPFSATGPLISWGGTSKAAARRAGRNGLGFIAQTNRPELQTVYEEAARDAGHEPGLCILPSPSVPLSVFVHDDVDAAWEEVGDALLADAVPYYDWNTEAGSAGGTASLDAARTVDELRKEHGSHRVVTVAEAAELVSTHGSLSLQPLSGGLDPDVAWPYLRRVVDEVLPSPSSGG
jgi:alkanesulfonate monooxygenase SsuD/methylene tetrahydromethanopterin reductase-like flavin-dependent oxidoreductase (luciferase family)